jgi:hypothetical protein
MSSTPVIKKMCRLHQQLTHHLDIPRIWLLWLPKKQGLRFVCKQIYFKPIFDIKHLENTLETLLNESTAFKNTKKNPEYIYIYITL